MPVEDHIRSVGTKSVTYPWLRRYIVVGPYGRHMRRDAAASVLARAILTAAGAAASARKRRRTPDDQSG